MVFNLTLTENKRAIFLGFKRFHCYNSSRIRFGNLFPVKTSSCRFFSLIGIKIRVFSCPSSLRTPFSIRDDDFRGNLALPKLRYPFFSFHSSVFHENLDLTTSPIRFFSCLSSLRTPFSIRDDDFHGNLALPKSRYPFFSTHTGVFHENLDLPTSPIKVFSCSSSVGTLFSIRHVVFHRNLAFTMTQYPFFPSHIGVFRGNLDLPTSPSPFFCVPLIRAFFCSSSSPLSYPSEQICDASSLMDLREESLLPDSEKVFNAIMENSYADQSMETALERVAVELTTEVVEQVLRKLHFEEKLAFRFFTWAGHQDGYSHQAQIFNEMIDILSSTKYKSKQFRIICDMLDYMKRNKKDHVPLDVLLMILRQYTEKHLSHLQKFTKKKKIRVKTQPEINAFNLLLDSLCKCGLVEEAEALFKNVRMKLCPDEKTYSILFFGWCRLRKPAKAMVVLEEMIKMGHTPENFTYNAAISAFCGAGMVSEASELFEFMRTKGSTVSSPTARTYSLMIVALAKANRTEECFGLITEMRNNGCLPDVSTYIDLIEGMCLAGKIEEAYKFLEEMGNKGYPPDIVTYNCFLKVLCNLRNAPEALRLFERIIQEGCVPSVQTFNMLITMFFNIGDPDMAFKMWREMDNKRCARDIDTYCAMIEGYFSCDRIGDASALLEDIVIKGMKLPYKKFDAFLMQLSEVGDLRTIHALSEHMRKFYNPAMSRRFAVSQKRKCMSLRRK